MREAAPLLVGARLADARRYEQVLGRGPDPDAIHDMRVAVRRLRAAIALSRSESLGALEPDVKKLQDALGGVRDLQVQIQWLERVARRGAGASAAPELSRAQELQVEVRVRALASALDEWSTRTAPALVRALATAGGRGRLGGSAIRRSVRKAVKKLGRRLEATRATLDPGTAHRLRIAVKKARYLAELAQPAFRRPAGKLLDTLVPLQERLGDLHDVDVRRSRLDELSGRGPPRLRRAARFLLPRVEADRSRRAARLAHELDRWNDGAIADRLERAFR